MQFNQVFVQTPHVNDGRNNGGAIYATVDISKKKKYAEPTPPSSFNYMNLEPATTTLGKPQAPTTGCNDRKSADNYMNLEFSESLCYYENAKNVLTKAGLQTNTCDKCGHQRQCANNGTGGDEKSDYMTMEPVDGQMVEVKRNLFPGYLPMCPAIVAGNNNSNITKQQDMLKDIMNKGLVEKSASIPSLNEYKSVTPITNGSSGGTTMKNKNLCRVNEPRRRSSSADSTSRQEIPDDEEPLQLSSAGASGVSDHTSSAESMTSQIAKCPADIGATASTASTISDESTANHQVSTTGNSAGDDEMQQAALVVHIRRSSSVPCKNNRDSSSSNDSGVSTGSLRYRGADFAEFELPLTTAMSTMRHRRTMAAMDGGQTTVSNVCVHGSLPRRSKSTDRLKELSFRFQKFAGPMKSSSDGAEVPVCLKKDKGNS